MPQTSPPIRIRYSLQWLDSDQPRRDLRPGVYRLGRAADCELQIDAQGVSRVHAELRICGDRGVLVRDLGSTNGTWVEGQRITEGGYSGDLELRIGSVRLRLRERLGGLDELASLATLPAQARCIETAPLESTAALDMARELRAMAEHRRPDQGWDAAAISLLLGDWSKRLNGAALQIDGADGEVWASAGVDRAERGRSELSELARSGYWRLATGRLPALAAAVLQGLAADLLLFASMPPPSKARSSGAHGPTDWPGLPSAAPRLQRTLRELERAARANLPVLLLGETGVGKELVANWLHRRSPRADGPFFALNCAALPQELLEAELFGVERGAATGVSERSGLIEQADGGTLFLDEVGDMALPTQVRLLRVLEDGCFVRVGGRRQQRVDVRVVSATNRALEAEVEGGRFRLDLYHRLAGFAATLPALRERPEDIVPLAIHFYHQALARLQRRSPGMTAGALLALQRHRWPGNVRELRQAIERGVSLLDEGEALDQVHLPEGLRLSRSEPDPLRLDTVLAGAERSALVTALALSKGVHELAWKRLGIGKTSFYKKLKAHGLGRLEAGEDELARISDTAT